MAGVAYASDLLTAGRALPPATSAGLSVADDVTHARSHFHTLTPLRSGCNAHFDRLRCGSSGKRFCADGPIPLAECVRACEETRGCGAVSLFRVGSALLADGTRHAYPGLHYFCRLLNSSCTASAEPGTCHATPRNWCSFALVPSRNCSASEQLRPTRLSSAASDSAVATQLAPQPEPTASARPRVYLGTSVVLGGGLNNMLMHVADLLRASCGRNATLVLPRLDGDPLASTYNATAYRRSPLASSSTLRTSSRPCGRAPWSRRHRACGRGPASCRSRRCARAGTAWGMCRRCAGCTVRCDRARS